MFQKVTKTARRLPPLNALRAFEAAARHGSLTKAAEELCVTHSAVSKQVALLEAWLGRAVFHREGRRLTLAPSGDALYREVSSAFQRIADAAARASPRHGAVHLHVTAPPTFMMRWLVPRLADFQLAHPAIQIHLSNRRDAERPLPEGYDLAIRRGHGKWPGMHAVGFMDERITPVCSPRLVKAKKALRPETLHTMTWLRAEMRPADWEAWLAHAGVTAQAPRNALYFDHTYLALEAAIDGLGVAMAPLQLIDDELQSGRLRLLFPRLVAPAPGYYIVCRKSSQGQRAVSAFIEWLRLRGAERKAASSGDG